MTRSATATAGPCGTCGLLPGERGMFRLGLPAGGRLVPALDGDPDGA